MSNYFEVLEKSEIVQRCYNLLNEISAKFNIFKEILDRKTSGLITEAQMKKEIRETLLTMDKDEIMILNEIGKMFSTSNCDWRDYEVRKYVHEEYMNLVHDNEL